MIAVLDYVVQELRDRILFVEKFDVCLSSLELDLRWGAAMEDRISLRFSDLIAIEFVPSSPGNTDEEWFDGADLGYSTVLTDPIREQFHLCNWSIPRSNPTFYWFRSPGILLLNVLAFELEVS